jgi:hypothetical protein
MRAPPERLPDAAVLRDAELSDPVPDDPEFQRAARHFCPVDPMLMILRPEAQRRYVVWPNGESGVIFEPDFGNPDALLACYERQRSIREMAYLFDAAPVNRAPI